MLIVTTSMQVPDLLPIYEYKVDPSRYGSIPRLSLVCSIEEFCGSSNRIRQSHHSASPVQRAELGIDLMSQS